MMRTTQRVPLTAGFSLVELMVGMLLGIILISGAVSIYLASKRSYVEVEQMAALSENARFAEQFIINSLRHAGFFGETPNSEFRADPGSAPSVANDCNTPSEAAAYTFSQFVFAATVDGSGNALGCISDGVKDTDVLVVKHVLPQPYSDGPRQGGDPNDPTQSDGIIDTPTALDPHKSYVLTNGASGQMYNKASTMPTINPGDTAWEYQYEVFYVRDTSSVPQLARGFLQPSGAGMKFVTENIAEGVINMQVMIGYDSNSGSVDTYKNPTGLVAGDWPNVGAVELYLLIRSAKEDPQYTEDKTYQLGDFPVTPGGNFRHIMTQTSVSLRNLEMNKQNDDE